MCIYNVKVPFCKSVSITRNLRKRAPIWAFVIIFASSKLALLTQRVLFYTSPRIPRDICESVCFARVEFKVSATLDLEMK